MPTIHIPLQCSLVKKITHYLKKFFMIMLSIVMIFIVGIVNIITIVLITAIPSAIIVFNIAFIIVAILTFILCIVVDGLILSIACDYFNIKFECIRDGDQTKVDDDYINFGDYVRKEIGMQCQYASFYLKGISGYPDLSKDLRLKGDLKDYHSILIHKDDAIEFKKRYDALPKWGN